MQISGISGTWKMWPWVWLRGAGFPADDVLVLEAAETRNAISAYSKQTSVVQVAVDAAIQSLEPAIEGRGGKERRPFSKAILKLRKGAFPANVEALAEAAPAVAAAIAEQEEADRLRAILEETFTKEAETIWRKLIDVAKSSPFREAIAWQNPQALRTGIEKIETSDAPKYQRLIANYLQRYCTKNDTIGFFGPISWGSVVRGDAVTTPGTKLLAGRKIFFAPWAIEALAVRLSSAERLKPSLRPRRNPTLSIQGDTMHYGTDKTAELPEEVAWLLENARGEKRGYELAAEASEISSLEFDNESDVYELLEELEQQGLVTWQIEIPGLAPYPEEYLRKELLGAGAAGEPGLQALAALEAKRSALAAAAGDPDAVMEALDALTEVFEEVSKTSSSRNAGVTYGARTIVFEDCVRDFDLEVPESAFSQSGDALSLVLKSGRWYSHEIARRYRLALDGLFDELAPDGGTVSYRTFHDGAVDLIQTQQDGPADIVSSVSEEVVGRWSQLIGERSDEKVIRLRATDIGERAAELFDAPEPGWPSARFHNLDFLLATKEISAKATGDDLLLVIGEFHAASVTVFSAAVTHPDCPYLPEVLEMYESAIPPMVEPVVAKDVASRAVSRSMSSRDFQVEFGDSVSDKPRSNVIAVGDLLVERDAGQLVVRSLDGRHRFDVVAFYDYMLSTTACSAYRFVTRENHCPRIMIDNVVIARESWNFACDELDFANHNRGAEQFLDAKAWSEKNGLPRWVFAKASEERKPLFVDFASPLTIEILCNQLRKSKAVRFTEMLPTFEQNWLQDADENRYTSELRTIFVDEVAWSQPQ